MIPIIEKNSQNNGRPVLLKSSFCSNNVLKAEVVIVVSNKMLTQEKCNPDFPVIAVDLPSVPSFP